MRALPERAVAAFTDAVLAERFSFLDAEQRSSTTSFVIGRWRNAAQPVHIGIWTAANALGGVVWVMAEVRGSDRASAWRSVVRQCTRRSLPLVSELSIFVSSLATAYAAERWPRAVIDHGGERVRANA